jgi:ElaB/YqjD/DUF883 family membrane-anchored ribosome-binding protein
MEAGRRMAESAGSFGSTVDRVATGAHEAVDKVAGAANAAAKVMEEKGGQLKAVQDRYLDQCRQSVRDNPLAAIGIALAAGLVISHLLSRR